MIIAPVWPNAARWLTCPNGTMGCSSLSARAPTACVFTLHQHPGSISVLTHALNPDTYLPWDDSQDTEVYIAGSHHDMCACSRTLQPHIFLLTACDVKAGQEALLDYGPVSAYICLSTPCYCHSLRDTKAGAYCKHGMPSA